MLEKKQMGRPEIKIDAQDLEFLGSLRCTKGEAAAYLKISRPTLDKKLDEPELKEAWERGQENAKVSLRRAQFEAAIKGNVPMLIWLGKQWLGQTDQPKENHDHSNMIMQVITALKTKE